MSRDRAIALQPEQQEQDSMSKKGKKKGLVKPSIWNFRKAGPRNELRGGGSLCPRSPSLRGEEEGQPLPHRFMENLILDSPEGALAVSFHDQGVTGCDLPLEPTAFCVTSWYGREFVLFVTAAEKDSG